MPRVLSFDMSGTDVPIVRLCDFPTGHATLAPEHQKWLRDTLAPQVKSGSSDVFVRFWGYASHLGGAGMNMRLSIARAEAAKRFLEQTLGQSLQNVEVGGYGEDRSAGSARDDSPVYRAVDVYFYRGHVPPKPTKPPEVPPDEPVAKMYIGYFTGLGAELIFGYSLATGLLWSSGSEDFFDARLRTITWGGHVGGHINVIIALAYGITDKSQLVGLSSSGWDWSLSIGAHFESMVKEAKYFAKTLKYVHNLGGARTVKTLKMLYSQSFAATLKKFIDEAGIDANSKTPTLFLLDIGPALEIGVFKGTATITKVG